MKQKESIHERIKQYAVTEPDLMYQELKLNQSGMSEEKASEYRQLYGSNEVADQGQDTILHCLRRAFVNPFSTILFFLGLISFVTDVLMMDSYRKNLTTVIIIFFMLLVSGIVRLIQELRSKRIADQLIWLVHTTVQVLRDGEWKELSSSELVVGDQVRLEAGDRVPADIRLTDAKDLFVSQSVITGESAILEKSSEILFCSFCRSGIDTGVASNGGQCLPCKGQFFHGTETDHR